MAERAAVFQKLQVGVESLAAPGTIVPAITYLPSLSLGEAIQADVTMYRPMGTKYPTVSAEGKEWMEQTASGPITYEEMTYILASAVQGSTDGSTPLAPVTTSSTYAWTFTSQDASPDYEQTYSFEQGSSVRAQKSPGNQFVDLGLEWTREECKLTGKVISQIMTDGITLTTVTNTLPLVPVVPNQVDVFLDTTFGGIGGTKMTRVMSCKFDIKNKVGPLWVLNSSDESYVGTVELAPPTTMDLVMEADTQGMALLPYMRVGSTVYVQVKALGGIIAGSIHYEMILNFCGRVSKPAAFSDNEGVYAIGWTLDVVQDTGAGYGYQFVLTNGLATL